METDAAEPEYTNDNGQLNEIEDVFPVSDGADNLMAEMPLSAEEETTPGETKEEAVAAFVAMADEPEEEVPFILPKASSNFPFGPAQRPDRRKNNLAQRLKDFAGNKVSWTSAGPVLILGFLVFCMVFVQATRPFMMLVNGSPIALVSDKEIGQQLLEQASLELSSNYPAAANFRQSAEVSYTKEGVPLKARATESQEILESLKTGITWLVDGWAISVNNERTVFLPSKADAEAVLADVKKLYLPEGDEVTVLDAEFVQPVELVSQEIPITSLGSADQALKMLTEGSEPIREHTVQGGESFWSIANKYGLTIDALKEINGITSNNLPVGKVLRLNSPQPLLSVKMMVSAVSQEEIPYETVYKANNNAWQGQTKVLTAGEAGTKEVKYQMAQINGVLVEKVVLSETIIAEPVDRVVENGTKTIVASRGDGGDTSGLAWPIRGRINSPFGTRSRGFHSGVDIQASTGDPIYSAEGGTVVQASYSGGYGNCVTIDHGDGLSTLYAHLSQMNVSVGQVVGRQELVGLAGTSGRTTGPHLHFEVRVNGSPTDPLNYLN